MSGGPIRSGLLALLALLGACRARDLDSQVFEGGRVHEPRAFTPAAPRITRLEPIGAYIPAPEELHATEIVSFDPQSQRLFVTNGATGDLDVVDLHDPRNPRRVAVVDVAGYGGAQVTSVDVADGLLAIAVVADPPQLHGWVVLLRAADLSFVNQLRLASLPDMVTFTPDRSKLVVACEGEPSDDLRDDPKGAIAIVELPRSAGPSWDNLASIGDEAVRLVGFEALELRPLDPRIHIHSAAASVAQDLEPEFVAVSADSRTAWVTLQENNALAIVDLEHATLRDVVALGETPLAKPDNRAFVGRPVYGVRQPDAVARVSVGGRDVVITANEGDCRAYTAMPELAAVAGLSLDSAVFPDAALLQRADLLGRVAVSAELGDLDHDGDYDELHACGARSISLWSERGELRWDSGALLERVSAHDIAAAELDFGPAPEGLVSGTLWQRPYVFVGLEQAGGIAVFDLSALSNSGDPSFVLYEHVAGDLAPEGLELIDAEHSPIGEPLLVVAYEVSRSVRIFRIVSE